MKVVVAAMSAVRLGTGEVQVSQLTRGWQDWAYTLSTFLHVKFGDTWNCRQDCFDNCYQHLMPSKNLEMHGRVKETRVLHLSSHVAVHTG